MIQVKDDKCSDEGSQGSTGEKWGDSEFFFFLIYLFIFGCVGSSFLCEGFL